MLLFLGATYFSDVFLARFSEYFISQFFKNFYIFEKIMILCFCPWSSGLVQKEYSFITNNL